MVINFFLPVSNLQFSHFSACIICLFFFSLTFFIFHIEKGIILSFLSSIHFFNICLRVGKSLWGWWSWVMSSLWLFVYAKQETLMFFLIFSTQDENVKMKQWKSSADFSPREPFVNDVRLFLKLFKHLSLFKTQLWKFSLTSLHS